MMGTTNDGDNKWGADGSRGVDSRTTSCREQGGGMPPSYILIIVTKYNNVYKDRSGLVPDQLRPVFEQTSCNQL